MTQVKGTMAIVNLFKHSPFNISGKLVNQPLAVIAWESIGTTRYPIIGHIELELKDIIVFEQES